ncbi:3-methyladenine DNA glycosylase AlkD [Pedobacter sp. CAN_A7]|uniref:DNA alkylation repair protein n=1 Tax=Pedobacter sp. CAN_A7 TaxID=2787722 RepID=UPI001A25C368
MSIQDGQSLHRPWKSFKNLEQLKLRAGDQLLLKRGSRFLEVLRISGQGEKGNIIRVDAYGEGNKPQVLAPDASLYAVLLSNSSYQSMQNLEIVNTGTQPMAGTGNIDARFLAILILDIKALSADDIDAMIRSVNFIYVADWLSAYVIKQHPNHEVLRERWMSTDHLMAARAGWSLTSGRVARNPDGLDIQALLNLIEAEMPNATLEVQWTMNTTLAQIGIHHPEYRDRALAMGEKMGIYRDYPVSKGCTSPFAPIWINEIVSRQGNVVAIII